MEPDPLLAEIETVLELYDISVTRFGYAVAGDPTIVTKMRKGRHIKKAALRDAISAALQRITENGGLT